VGAYTPNAQVWYPGTGDTAELNVLLATLASSIENGLEPRLARQELAVGLKAGLATQQTLSTTFVLAPMSITGNNGSFNQGLTISAGVVTVVTPGMYLISGALGITNTAGKSSKIQLRKNGSVIAADEQASSASYYQVAKANTVVNCIAGDTLSMFMADGVGGVTTSIDTSLTHFTVAMIQALPV
jgi:hypothetical protein